jgi:hypothetical protein
MILLLFGFRLVSGLLPSVVSVQTHNLGTTLIKRLERRDPEAAEV